MTWPSEPAETAEPASPERASPTRRNQAAARLVRRQYEAGSKLAPLAKVGSLLDWRESRCLLVVGASGKATPRELAAITGIPEPEVVEMPGGRLRPYIKSMAFAAGTYYVPRDSASLD